MVSLQRRAGRALAVLAVASLLVPAAGADKSREAEKDEKSEKVYTTEDLERLYGGRKGKAKSKAAEVKTEPRKGEAAGDPLSRLQRQQADQAERKRLVAEAERKITEAKKRVEELEQRIRATKNPLLARPKIPDEERAEWDGQDTAGRVRSSEEKLRQARQELEQAKAELARLRSAA